VTEILKSSQRDLLIRLEAAEPTLHLRGTDASLAHELRDHPLGTLVSVKLREDGISVCQITELGIRILNGEGALPMPGKRELIDTGKGKRFVRRNDKGQFKEIDDVGKSLAQDVRKPAKIVVKPGHGDQGDQKRK
jgi:hypothetical protein